jgi:hypothetical protein
MLKTNQKVIADSTVCLETGGKNFYGYLRYDGKKIKILDAVNAKELKSVTISSLKNEDFQKEKLVFVSDDGGKYVLSVFTLGV